MYGGTDHYAVLGLTPSADDVVVHAAWKALLRKHHPDTNPDDPTGARAREINEAFAVLGKPEARARYDRTRPRRPEIVPLRHPPFLPPPRRRFSATRLFGAVLLIVAATPVAIAALLSYPGTAPATERALVTYTGRSFAEDLIARVDTLVPGTVARPGSPTANDSDTGNSEMAARN